MTSGLGIVGFFPCLILHYEKKLSLEFAPNASEIDMQFTLGAEERLLRMLQRFVSATGATNGEQKWDVLEILNRRTNDDFVHVHIGRLFDGISHRPCD